MKKEELNTLINATYKFFNSDYCVAVKIFDQIDHMTKLSIEESKFIKWLDGAEYDLAYKINGHEFHAKGLIQFQFYYPVKNGETLILAKCLNPCELFELVTYISRVYKKVKYIPPKEVTE